MLSDVMDTCWTYCKSCDEEYDVPEDLQQCPICGEDIEEV